MTLFSVRLSSEASCDAEKLKKFFELIYKVYHDEDLMILHMDNTPIFILKKWTEEKVKTALEIT